MFLYIFISHFYRTAKLGNTFSSRTVMKMEKHHFFIQDDRMGRVALPGMRATAVMPVGEGIDPSGPMPC